MLFKSKRTLILVAAAATVLALLPGHTKEEGMFPLNYLNEKDLQAAGMKLTAAEIFNPDGVALTNALVKVGGCTGSFISDKGLIITNHHCVFGGVAKLSTAENNYLENGFVAANYEQELPIDMPCRITESYSDVSQQVLKGVDDKMDAAQRAALITANSKKIREEEIAKNPGLSIEISEMFVGKSYTLFRYFLITDVRLVFAPPLAIGQFGGDLDNWEWPRHNGDFSMVRAYVGKDGKPAKFSKDNVPFKPEKHLKINAKGTKENDFVFIMGYPGKTYRHESAGYLEFQEEFQLPEIQKWYKWCIDEMREVSVNDENKYLAFAGNIQSLENVEKNYRGKIQGLKRTAQVKRKYSDEQAMQLYAKENSSNTEVIAEINTIWKRKKELAKKRFTYLFLNSQSAPFAVAHALGSCKEARAAATQADARSKALSDFKNYTTSNYKIIDKTYEINVLNELLQRVSGFMDLKPIVGKGGIEAWVKTVVGKKEKLLDTAWTGTMARSKTEKLLAYQGPLMKMYNHLKDDMLATEMEWNELDLKLKSLMPRYLDLKQQYKSGQFIPDANSTLRLTYGYIKRYSPNDAEIHYPYTTLRGIFEKANTAPDYKLPQVLADNLRVDNVPDFFKDPQTGEVIVCFLYNLDTTGGNSGSPVLDANGDLIGVNFDRSFTATINDYAWNDKYSRSIGVDIRYVLFVMKYAGKADHLIQELGLDI